MSSVSDPFRDRVAVITGGGGGIGRALARAFAAGGAHLVLADLHEDSLAEAKAQLSESGSRVLAVQTDVTRRESVEKLADAAFGHYGQVHIVCNNAGIAVLGPLTQATPADWEVTMATNFWGVVYGVDAFLPRLLEQKQGGHFVNTASMAGLVGMLGLGIYCASKFAVVGLSESLRRELHGSGIGVSVLCPMIVDTPIAENTRRVLQRSSLAPGDIAAPAPNLVKGGVIAAKEVARRVVHAIERDDLYVLTHPEQREILRRRAAKQDAAFEDEHWNT